MNNRAACAVCLEIRASSGDVFPRSFVAALDEKGAVSAFFGSQPYRDGTPSLLCAQACAGCERCGNLAANAPTMPEAVMFPVFMASGICRRIPVRDETRMALPHRLVGAAILLLLAIVLFPLSESVPAAETTPGAAAGNTPGAAPRTVRVGWYEASGLFRSAEDGRISGYVPALLETMSRLTGWRYEWVELSHDEIPAALAEGRIDLSCDTSSATLPGRPNMQFSSIAAGVAVLTIHALQDTPLHFMDFSDFSGKTFGLLRSSYTREYFAKFAKTMGFRHSVRLFRKQKEMYAALQDGSIDTYVDGSLQGAGTILGTFDAAPFFFVTAPGDKELLPQIDEAMRQVHINNPHIFAQLFESFFIGDRGVSIRLGREEEVWLESKPVLRVAYSRRQPMMDAEGRMPLLHRLFELLEQRSGIRMEFVPADTYEQALRMVQDGKADAVTDLYFSGNFARNYGMTTSRIFLSSPITLAVRQNVRPGSRLRIGVTPEMTSVKAAYQAVYPADIFVDYATRAECLEAFAQRRIDAYIPQSPGMLASSSELAVDSNLILTRAVYPMAIGISQSQPRMAVDVISKTLCTISANELEDMQQVRDMSPLEEMWQFIRRHPLIPPLAGGTLGLLILLRFLLRSLSRGKSRLRTIERIALTDPLTGGPNRPQFQMDADALLLRDKTPSVLVCINICRLKHVNVLKGYSTGDFLISRCHEELRRILPPHALCAHMGAGKFLCLWHCDSKEAFHEIMERIFGIASGIGAAVGHAVIFTAGACFITRYDGDVSSLILAAETAESSLSRSRYQSSYTIYDESMHALAKKITALESRMQQALQDEEFVVHLQPQVCLRDGSISGAEALVRWYPKDGTTIYPDEFIPLFEKNGFIRELDIYVLDCVCRWLRARLDAGQHVVPISVNQSRALFLREGYAETFFSVLEKWRIPHNLIKVEVTERLAGFDEKLFKTNMYALKAQNIEVALDDFGKGYSSLSSLQSFPIDIIKLDKEFLSASNAQAVLDALLLLGQRLGMKTLCEGIEEEEQLSFLRDNGCVYGQGYFIARPMPIADFEAFLQNYVASGDAPETGASRPQ